MDYNPWTDGYETDLGNIPAIHINQNSKVNQTLKNLNKVHYDRNNINVMFHLQTENKTTYVLEVCTYQNYV